MDKDKVLFLFLLPLLLGITVFAFTWVFFNWEITFWAFTPPFIVVPIGALIVTISFVGLYLLYMIKALDSVEGEKQ